MWPRSNRHASTLCLLGRYVLIADAPGPQCHTRRVHHDVFPTASNAQETALATPDGPLGMVTATFTPQQSQSSDPVIASPGRTTDTAHAAASSFGGAKQSPVWSPGSPGQRGGERCFICHDFLPADLNVQHVCKVDDNPARHVAADIRNDDLCTLYCFIFMVWRMGTILLTASSKGESLLPTGRSPFPAPTASHPAGHALPQAFKVCLFAARLCCRIMMTYCTEQAMGLEVMTLWSAFQAGCTNIWSKRVRSFDVGSAKVALRLSVSVVVASLFAIFPRLQHMFDYSFWAAVRSSGVGTHCLTSHLRLLITLVAVCAVHRCDGV